MPPEHSWFTHHVCCFKKAWNRKNVLENILVKLQRDKDDIIMSPHVATISQLFFFYYITFYYLKKARNNKNVLKNILHVADFTTWALLRTKDQNDITCLQIKYAFK